MTVNALFRQLTQPITFSTPKILLGLSVLFFASGCAALIYQIMWQRMLFMVFGIDMLSVTIIVSVFMFGLGVGGLCGGYIADLWPKKLLTLYIVIEFCIAAFGFISPALIDFMGDMLFSRSELVTMLANFLILAIPTILMGATFPILVTHVNQYYQNIGSSVGRLYFANTIGAAVGACYAGFILLSVMDIAGAIYCAAVLNLLVGFSAFLLFRQCASC